MRLSVTQARSEEQAYELANTMADLGFCTRMGVQISAVPDAEYPWDPSIVKAIRREFDPCWTPLFAREAWMTPAKTVLVIGRHMVGRYVPIPRSEVEVLNVLRPTHAPWGVRIQAPLLEAMTLEIRNHLPGCDCRNCTIEQETGGMVRKDLGEYVPFDGRIYHTCKAMWQQNHQRRVKDLVREIDFIQNEVPKLASRAAMEELRADLKDDWKRLERIRKAETDYDRQKAMAPPPTRPSVLVGKAAGVKGAAA